MLFGSTPQWPKMKQKIIILTTGQILSLNQFGLAGLPIEAILDFQILISQLFEELQGINSDFQLITPISGTYFDTKQSQFGLEVSAMVALLEF